MAVSNNDDINAIRMKADIVSIIGSYIPLTQRGKNYVCVCPFHDDHSPSMSVSPEKQIYKCFACGKTGNVFTFVSEFENVPFLDAVRIVADKCGMNFSKGLAKDSSIKNSEEFKIMELAEKFYQNNLRTEVGKEALTYLEQRGITEAIVKEFGIGLSLDSSDTLLNLLSKKGYDEKKLLEIGLINQVNGKFYDMFSRRITFPLWDKDGHIVGFSARIYRGEKDVSKYMNSRESGLFKKGETLYNFHNARDVAKREKKMIVVEGFMDAIRISSIGIKNVVALQGTAMTSEQVDLLKKLRVPVILCLDNDNAGEIATVSNGAELVKHNVETFVIRLSGEKDPDEYILANGKEAFVNNIEHASTYLEFQMNYLKKNKDLNKVEDLTDYINGVLKNLTLNDDPILRELTLNKISKEYDISIDLLKSKLAEMKPVKEEVKKEPEGIKKVRKDTYMIGSEKILFFMMNGDIYIEEYKNKLGFFSEPIYREIANEIVYYAEQNGEITVADFITYVEDKESIKDKVMEIVNDAINDEITIEAMDEYIVAVSKVMKKKEIQRLKEEMKKEMDIEKKMKIAEQIAELKKEDV